MALPASFSRSHVDDDAHSGIGGLADADGGHVRWHLESLVCDTEPVAVGGQDEPGAFAVGAYRRILEVGRVEFFWIHHGAGHVAEDLELAARQAQVVAITGTAIAQRRDHPAVPFQVRRQRRDQLRCLANPGVVFEHKISATLSIVACLAILDASDQS